MSESFDRALRWAARRGRPAGVCPDAASLAAYADNGLTADERRRVEAHAADCATCLEHLALLGAISLEREAPEPSRSWLVRWGWLVPVATAVVVVAVWVRLPEQKVSEDAGPPASARTQAVAPAAPEQEVASSKDLAAQRLTADRDAQDQAKQRQAAKTSQAVPARPAAPLEKKVDALAPLERRDQERQNVAATSPVPPAAPEAPAAAPPSPAAVQAQKAGEEDVRRQRLGAASKVAQPAATPPAFADAMKEGVRAELQASPGTYRAAGNRIEQSKDGGTTWRTALSDPHTTFTLVGCAPGGLCWIGTADGQMLRPIPGGFARSVLPVRARVVAITSSGSQAAVVTVEGGQQFRTSDGGATWAPIQ